MKPQPTFSPVSLRYIAALRGCKPKRAGTGFAYAEFMCTDPERLTSLAASNPEGRFYGFVADETARSTAEETASERGTFNIVFIAGTPSEILTRLTHGASVPPLLDYLCCDEREAPLSPTERSALFDIASQRLNPGGTLVTSYRAYDSEDGALSLLVRTLAPEMTSEQKQEFLTELKRMGSHFLSRHPEVMISLNEAIIKGTPESFFAPYKDMTTAATTIETIKALGARNMLYAGDATLGANYVEFALPPEAQELVTSCRTSPLYEPIKDYALNRATRSDIWVKTPIEQSADQAELFGSFAYGLTMPRADIGPWISINGRSIDLSAPLYGKLLDLMALMPIGVGDVLAHPTGEGENPALLLESLQILVACGIAIPMRGQLTSTNQSNMTHPRLVGNFNRSLDKVSLSDTSVWMASQVMGCGVKISAKEALVMQALNRAGLSNSVSALMPELTRLTGTTALATLFPTGEPTPELAQGLVREIVSQSLPQWYAYALLEAA